MQAGVMKAGGIQTERIQTNIIKTRAVIVFLLLAVLLMASLFSGCSSSSKSGGAKSPGTPQQPEQSRGEAGDERPGEYPGEGREELGAESGAAQQPNSSPISRGAINNEYSPGNGRLIVKLEILDNLISYESVSYARVDITPQGIDASLSIDVSLDVGDESARLDFGYVAFGRYFLNATIYHSNGNALAYSELLIDVGLDDDTQIDRSQVGDAEIQTEDIRPNIDETDPSLAEYTATLVFDSSSALFRLVTLPLVFTDDDNDGLLDVWHPAYLAAITDDLDGSYELIADLDLSSWGNWQPLGNRVQPFEGIFVGNGHSISGLSSRGYSSAGLFGVVEGASITDLMVEVWQINASGYYSLNGYFLSSDSITNSSSDSSGASYAGAVAGAVAGLARSSTFANITVMMSSYDDELSYITAFGQNEATNVGGLVGHASNSTIANTTIMASGLISGVSSIVKSYAKTNVGGLAGFVDNGSDIINVAVTGKADVRAGGLLNALSGNYRSGGLLGGIRHSRMREVRVALSGDITTDNGKFFSAGGAVGECHRSSVVDINIVVAGNILAEHPLTNGYAYAGGVLGEAYECGITNVVSETFGLISAVSSSFTSAGGLVGYAEYVTISNIRVTHHGDAFSSGKYCNVGGLMGYYSFLDDKAINNTSAIINGNLIAGKDNNPVRIHFNCQVGGMIGYLEGGAINNSYAIVSGDVQLYSNGENVAVGGMVGRSATGILEITNSYALIKGNLAATSFFAPAYAGGLVGISEDKFMTVRNSYVQILGNITLRSILPEDDAISYGGNFIGLVERASGSFTNTYVFVGGAISSIRDSLPAIFGGTRGSISTAQELHNITFSSSYYRSQRELSEGDFNSAEVGGYIIDVARSDLQLRCPQAAGQNCGGPVMPGNPKTYVGWDESVWDFGTADELPRLRIFPSTNLLD